MWIVQQGTKNEVSKDKSNDDSISKETLAIELLPAAKSIGTILTLCPQLSINIDNLGIDCKICKSTMGYDFSLGDSFEMSSIPPAFANLKISIKRHFYGKTHKTNQPCNQTTNQPSSQRKMILCAMPLPSARKMNSWAQLLR